VENLNAINYILILIYLFCEFIHTIYGLLTLNEQYAYGYKPINVEWNRETNEMVFL
jgi:hypothetical protein